MANVRRGRGAGWWGVWLALAGGGAAGLGCRKNPPHAASPAAAVDPAADAFVERLRAALADGDRAFLEAVVAPLLAEGDQREASYRAAVGPLARWLEGAPTLRCLERLCLLRDTGGRPVAYFERAPDAPAGFRSWSSGDQVRRFSRHYGAHLEVEGEGAVAVRVNGADTFVFFGPAGAGEHETSHVNDWLRIGANTLELVAVDVPEGKSLRVSFGLGSSATYVPSIDPSRSDVIAWDGTLEAGASRSFSFEAPAAAPPPPPATGPQDLAAHLAEAFPRWVDGGREEVFLPWLAWVDDEKRDALARLGARSAELLWLQLDVRVGDGPMVHTWVRPTDAPALLFARVADPRTGDGGLGTTAEVLATPELAPLVPYTTLAAAAAQRLRDCTPPAPPEPAWREALAAAPTEAQRLDEFTTGTAAAWPETCAAVSALPADAPIAWAVDDGFVLLRDATGRPVGTASLQFGASWEGLRLFWSRTTPF